MDWYLIGRVLGAIIWPIAVATAVYAIVWLIAAPRPEHEAQQIKRWGRLAAAIAFFATLFVTVREFLRYTAA